MDGILLVGRLSGILQAFFKLKTVRCECSLKREVQNVASSRAASSSETFKTAWAAKTLPLHLFFFFFYSLWRLVAPLYIFCCTQVLTEMIYIFWELRLAHLKKKLTILVEDASFFNQFQYGKFWYFSYTWMLIFKSKIPERMSHENFSDI